MATETESPASGESTEALDRLFRLPVGRTVFDNGLVLVHRPDFSADVVSVQVWVRTGSIHEDALLGSGVSHFLEHLLFKGTETRDAKAIGREVHALGGVINAYTTFDRTVYHIDGPSDAFGAATDLLADMVPGSLLPEEEVRRERDVILREIDMGLDDPGRRLGQSLFRTAFRRHPYREPVIGHRDLFLRVTREELERYYHARYVPNNMVVSVVGAVTPEECTERIGATFGALPRGRLAPPRIEPEPVQLAPRREDARADFNVQRGGIAYKVPHLSHPDAPKLDALAHALGGGESSVLWRELRNRRGLVHDIDCRNWSPGEQGLLWISYICDPGRAEAVESAVESVLDGVRRDGVDPASLEKARRQALTAEINGRKTMSGQAARLGLGEVVIGDIHYARRYLRRLGEVGPGDLREVARAYLTDSGRSTVTLGPETGRGVDAADAAAAKPPEFETVTFAGGGRLLLQPDPKLPKVHFRVVLRGGPLFEDAGKRGVSALLAELLVKDTERRDADAVNELVERLGGSFVPMAGNNTIGFSLEVLPEDVPTALELLSDALARPAFAEETVAREREAQLSDLREADDEILEFGFRKLRERFFGGHPFAVEADGRIGDVAGLTRGDVAAQFRRLAAAPNVVVAVCGDFSPEAVSGGLRPVFEDNLRAGPVAPVGGADAWPGPEAADVAETIDREQAVVLYGFPDAGLWDREGFARGEMLHELFSGMSSRLFERVREDAGMAYFVGSTRVVGLDCGMFAFYAGTHPDLAGDVRREIEDEIARVASGGVTDAELERCRTRLKAARPMGRQTIGARAMHAALQTTYGLTIDDDAEYAERLEAIGADALADFAREYFDPAKRVRMVVARVPLHACFGE